MSTTTTTPTTEAFADELVGMVGKTFFRAYYSRANGMTEEEMLIDHDIEAAFHGVDKHLAETARRTIRAAVKAVEGGVPYHVASTYLLAQLRDRIGALLKQRERKCRKVTRAFVLHSINHAVDENQ